MTKILIADDHPIVLGGLAGLFQDAAFSVVAHCSTGEEVLQALPHAAPEILVLDVQMPPPGGIEILRKLKSENDRPSPAVVLLTSSMDDDQLLEAVRLGVDGVVLKESAPRQLLRCLETVVSGDQWFDPQIAHRLLDAARLIHAETTDQPTALTPRELAVTRLAAAGLRNKEIARELNITEGTVKIYLHRIFDKLNVKSRVELTILARNEKIL